MMKLANLDESRAEKLYGEAVGQTYPPLAKPATNGQATTKTPTNGQTTAKPATNGHTTAKPATNAQSPPGSPNRRRQDPTGMDCTSKVFNPPLSPRNVTASDFGRPSPHRKQRHQENRVEASAATAASSLKETTKGAKGDAVADNVPAFLYCQPVSAPTIAGYDPDYLHMVDSYRKIYCNRCKMFDCNIHGLAEKPSLQLSYELGISMERDGKNRPRERFEDTAFQMPPPLNSNDRDPFGHLKELTEFHRKISKRMFLIYEGDIEQMALVMMAPLEPLQRYVQQQKWEQPESKLVPPMKEDQNTHYHSLKNYDHRWYSRIVKGGLRPSYEPCVHEEPCKEGKCGCVERQVFCTSACAWGSRSRNFFRGCDCRSNCEAKSCSCYANARECNPDICRCDTCCDPPGGPTVEQRCRNDNLTMQRGTEILIGRSGIPNAGWGAFSKRALKKNDFIGEYVGEIITQEEADRRGQLYDIQNHSSLFMLTADVALDADRQGNHLRYINHSSNPNTTPRTITVNGDNRIGFFALQDIPSQTELSFNYGYNFSVDNDFVLKSAKAVPWMEDSAPSDKEDNSTTSSRGKKKAPPKVKASTIRYAAAKVAENYGHKKRGKKSIS